MNKNYLALLASGTTIWLGRNYHQQYQALENPDKANPDGRLGAMLAAKDFNPDQVGFGVFPSIRLIHTIFGNIGEQHIGSVFNTPEAQEIMRSLRTPENHRRLGAMEQQYWQSERRQGKNIGDELMIIFGANTNPDVRADLQEKAAQLRNLYKNS
jgi:hypothetical protein